MFWGQCKKALSYKAKSFLLAGKKKKKTKDKYFFLK